MQQFLSHFNLHVKLLFSFAILLVFSCTAFFIVRSDLVDMQVEVSAIVNEYRPIENKAAEIRAKLDDAIATLGLYVSVREDAYAEDYRQTLAEAKKIANKLSENPRIQKYSRMTQSLNRLEDHIEKLSIHGEEIIKVSSDDELTYPGLAYANKNMSPIVREIIQLITQMIYYEQAEADDDRRELLLRKADFRYDWIQVVGGVRAYLAYRSDEVLHDTNLYFDNANKALRDIASHGYGATLEEEEAIAQLEKAMKNFKGHWDSLLNIHTSEGWRADSHLMRIRIAPLFNEIKVELDAFIQQQHVATDATTSDLLDDSQTITRLVEIILIAGVLTSGIIAWTASRLVSMPIHRISHAMECIARGEADLSQRLPVNGKDEVALLASSFNTFIDKAQHRSEEEHALSELLHLSLRQSDLSDYLTEVLELMIGTVTWLGLLPKGGIFLKSESKNNQLDLMASHNLSPEILTLCEHLPFGKCLCGRAALSGEIIFSDSIDERHDITFEGIQPHGHYSVPIMQGLSVLGVLVLYIPEGHKQSVSEERFLSKVANVLSMGITLRLASNDLIEAKKRAENISDQLTGITANIPGIIYQCRLNEDGQHTYPYVSAGTGALIGTSEDNPVQDIERLFSNIHAQDKERIDRCLSHAKLHQTPLNEEYRVLQENGNVRWLLCQAVPRKHPGGYVLWDGLIFDITDRKELETQLLQAQKLETVGQLAAGVAHEINTPMQYVRDNTQFLQEAFEDYNKIMAVLRRLRKSLPEDVLDASLVKQVDREIEEADIDHLSEDIPQAINQSLEGLQRIITIVSAMKEFSHPGKEEKQGVDMNAVIQNVVTVTRNEWKYVAELHTELDNDLPTILGHRDKLGQVILNLIVNAAHAIADEVADGKYDQGRILVRTLCEGQEIRVHITDNGSGVPESIKEKIFDPFFTTKDVGKGTGQGLSIARSVVVDQHQGSLSVQSSSDQGTEFVIRLPL